MNFWTKNEDFEQCDFIDFVIKSISNLILITEFVVHR